LLTITPVALAFAADAKATGGVGGIFSFAPIIVSSPYFIF